MASQFASEQPAGFKNHIENVAIVGAAGRSGGAISDALIKGKKHRVTAITRPDSTNKMPSGLHDIKTTGYDDHALLVKALEGQDALIITMSVTAPPESQTKLIDAAVEAGVKWIMPNEWGYDLSKDNTGDDIMPRARRVAVREYLDKVGTKQTQWITLCCGFWYEFSLAGTEARYGFDFDKKKVTYYDDGNTKINTSTFSQVGRAVASLLSMKILPDNENDKSAYLSQYAHRAVRVSSFFVSQRDMYQSVLKVTGDSEQDWTITHEDVVKRFHRGQRLLKEGQMVGFGILLYARVFYKDGAGDYNDELDNAVLGLPEENLDEATKIAVEMARAGTTNAL